MGMNYGASKAGLNMYMYKLHHALIALVYSCQLRRDLFANFERMRREMDELFGDHVLDRGSRRGAAAAGSRPRWTSSTPATRRGRRLGRAGGHRSERRIQLEITGRELVLSGQRETDGADDRVYQQLEIERGPFRRVVSLGAGVDADSADATYEDGILTVELPLSRPARPPHRPDSRDGPNERRPRRRCPQVALAGISRSCRCATPSPSRTR